MSYESRKGAYTQGIGAFIPLFNLLTLNESKAVMICIDSLKARIMTAFNKKFLQGGPGGAVFSKSAPPWPPEAKKSLT
jgi:hypothetical protein